MNHKHPISCCILAFLYAIIVLLPSDISAQPRSGQPTPNFKVITTSGQPVSLENYRGHVLLIDFFATWCQPCRVAVPHLVELDRKYGKQGLQLLGLSVDDGESAIKIFAREQQVSYPLAISSEREQTDFGIRSIPVMFLIDKKGNIAEVFRGFSAETGRSMETMIKRLLAEK